MSIQQKSFDVIIIGAGAAGLMCAIEAGKCGRTVVVLDHAKKIGEKIRISGGGRCNFTNIYTEPSAFLSQNPHFCKSALKQYTQHDFVELVEKHGIAYHEKTLGQLFCDGKSQQIIDMLLEESKSVGVEIHKEITVESVQYADATYAVKSEQAIYTGESLVIATGGLSIPKIGATKFGYIIAKQFGHDIIETSAALVPLTFTSDILDFCKSLSGVSVDAEVKYKNAVFKEGLLFTHRGLSGPSILQISSYWEEGHSIEINLASGIDVYEHLSQRKETTPKQDIQTVLADVVPKRLAEAICGHMNISGKIAEQSKKSIQSLSESVNKWRVKPNGTEGYRTAEVTLGGVDTNQVSSKTMESKLQPNLYFIGEVLDVTGHLGGYNFQWAWSSGYVAGQNV